MSYNITIEGGSSVRLPTAGKYCDRDIVITAEAGTDTSDATAMANEIFSGETAYIADGKVIGTFAIDNELTTQDDLISQIQTAIQGKASGGGNDILSKLLSGKELEALNDDNVTYIKNYGLGYDTSIKTLILKNMTSGGTSCFAYSTALETVDLPSLKNIPYTAFMNSTALKNVNIPGATGVSYGAFNGCSSIERLDIPAAVNYINAQTFGKCTNLITLILRQAQKVATLNNVNAFSGTPIASETGYIYVPSALVESYKSASNWSTYAGQFRAIEDYPDICG